MATVNNHVLSDKVLAGCAERAGAYDRENRFFAEDFEELKKAGYLNMAVPKELGGRGMTIAEVARETRRLAYHAPPTALGTNMHIYWTGVAADLWNAGDKSLEWLLKDTVAGEVFAAGHGELGNDLPVFLSTATAEKVDGGYRFKGHKMFGSLTPVWTQLGIHAMDSNDERGPQIIHAFMPRDTEGYNIKETWDVLGMRATRSDDTVLEDVFLPDDKIGRIVPAGQGDPFVLSVFAWALIGFANVYYGLAQRALELACEAAKKRTSLAVSRSMAYHPEVQHSVAQAALAVESMGPYVERIAQDWAEGADHGEAWPAKLVAVKHHCVEGAWKVVDLAMDLSGGGGMFKRNELERLFRDARCGRFHPANANLVHEIVAKTALGIDLGEQPRWG
jgi:alkylation response protein AidB-like acyl-CoA dehydrogenase